MFFIYGILCVVYFKCLFSCLEGAGLSFSFYSKVCVCVDSVLQSCTQFFLVHNSFSTRLCSPTYSVRSFCVIIKLLYPLNPLSCFTSGMYINKKNT